MFIEDVLIKIIGIKAYNQFILYLEKEGKDFDNYYLNSMISFAVITLFLIVFLLFANMNVIVFFIILIFAFPFSFILNYIFIIYKEEARQKQITQMLPDFLLQASLMPKGSDIIDILKNISKQDFGFLSKEFSIALNQIEKGFDVETGLKGIIIRNNNKTLKRIINLLIIGYKSGKDLSFVFNKLSQDLLQTEGIERDRYSGLAIQKYTLLLSSMILVPLILSWVFGIVQNMNLGGFVSSDIVKVQTNMFFYSKYAIYIYIFEFSLLSSIFISIIDGNWKKFVLYSIFLVPIAYLVFFFL